MGGLQSVKRTKSPIIKVVGLYSTIRELGRCLKTQRTELYYINKAKVKLIIDSQNIFCAYFIIILTFLYFCINIHIYNIK